MEKQHPLCRRVLFVVLWQMIGENSTVGGGQLVCGGEYGFAAKADGADHAAFGCITGTSQGLDAGGEAVDESLAALRAAGNVAAEVDGDVHALRQSQLGGFRQNAVEDERAGDGGKGRGPDGGTLRQQTGVAVGGFVVDPQVGDLVEVFSAGAVGALVKMGAGTDGDGGNAAAADDLCRFHRNGVDAGGRQTEENVVFGRRTVFQNLLGKTGLLFRAAAFGGSA